MRWGEWDSCPFHHKDLDTYVASSHALIQSQWAYLYGCHVWHQWCEVPLIHIDGVRSSSHKGVGCLDYYELANMWKLGGVVECHVGKASLTYVRLDTIMFHYGWCPTSTSSIAIGCTLAFYFCCIVLCFSIMLAWGFHNIFIVHGKGHGKHIDVGCTMVGLCGVNFLSQIFFAHGTYIPWKKSRIQWSSV